MQSHTILVVAMSAKIENNHKMYRHAEAAYVCLSFFVNLLFLVIISAIEVAEDLRKYILEIYGDFLSPDGFVSTSYKCSINATTMSCSLSYRSKLYSFLYC